MIQGKIWGWTKPLIVTPLVELHEIWVEPNMQCSLHKHEHKWNAFYVIEGMLKICVEKNDYQLTDLTVLTDNQLTSVPPNEFHQFQTGDQTCHALELYYLEPISQDIIRKTVGSALEL